MITPTESDPHMPLQSLSPMPTPREMSPEERRRLRGIAEILEGARARLDAEQAAQAAQRQEDASHDA